MSNIRFYWLHALSPTHTGVGRGLGYIDLPIDRDGITGWPIIRGSAFKGVWAAHFQATALARENNEQLRSAFGKAGGKGNSSNAGALIPTDARLVCLPVRSFRGTFAWCSSPMCLQMLRRTFELSGMKDIPSAPTKLDEIAHVSETSELVEDEDVILEDLNIKAQKCGTANAWAELISKNVFSEDSNWQKIFKERFVVLPDSTFNFLTETGTEVHTRIKINERTKTVDSGALWFEESLPSETILVGVVQCNRVFSSNGTDCTAEGLIEEFATKPLSLQIGGKATVGRGQMRCLFTCP